MTEAVGPWSPGVADTAMTMLDAVLAAHKAGVRSTDVLAPRLPDDEARKTADLELSTNIILTLNKPIEELGIANPKVRFTRFAESLQQLGIVAVKYRGAAGSEEGREYAAQYAQWQRRAKEILEFGGGVEELKREFMQSPAFVKGMQADPAKSALLLAQRESQWREVVALAEGKQVLL